MNQEQCQCYTNKCVSNIHLCFVFSDVFYISSGLGDWLGCGLDGRKPNWLGWLARAQDGRKTTVVGLVVSFLVAWTRKTPRMLVPVSAKRMIKKHEVK